MKTNNYIKVMCAFFLGWTLSGFGLTHIPEEIKKPANDQTEVNANTNIPLTLTLSLINSSDNSIINSGYRVDISQCSKQRPYGGNLYNCQPLTDEAKNTIGNTAIRQSQYTNANGQVTFTASYPDKYSAPTTHFHVTVYDRFNTLIASSQFDFPTAVYSTMNAFYKAGGKNPATILAEDPTANPPLLVTGTLTSGFAASRTIFIPANSSGIEQTYSQSEVVSDLKNFPNPVINSTTFAFHLAQTSEVEITVTDNTGTQVKTIFTNNLAAGPHEIEVDLDGLQKGIYFYRLQVSNKNGTFNEAKKLIKV